MLYLRAVITVLLMVSGAFAASVSSITQHGITWTFDKAYESGQFCSGDYWVVGPVTITSITRPQGNPERDGTMINPPASGTWGNPVQGWDSRQQATTYDSTLNVANRLPLLVAPGSSVCSALSLETVGRNQALNVIAVLTVLTEAPPAGSFRPSIYSSDKSILWNKDQIDYSGLLSLQPAPGTPSLTTVVDRYDRAYVVLSCNYNANYHSPYQNLPYPGKNYGREHAQGASEAALLLNLNYTNAEKEPLAIGFIQWGLDIYSASQMGVTWGANGGHQHGRKLPMLMAGIMLNDTAITSAASNQKQRFQEDCNYFYVTQEDVDLPRYNQHNGPIEAGEIGCDRAYVDGVCPNPIYPYTADMIGMADWGPNTCTQPSHAGSNKGRWYRETVCIHMLGHALVCHLMGIEDLWNNEAFFDYYNDRWWGEWSGWSSPAYVRLMWQLYRNAGISGYRLPGTMITGNAGTAGAWFSVTGAPVNTVRPGPGIYLRQTARGVVKQVILK